MLQMKRIFLFGCLFLLFTNLWAQDIVTKQGFVSFFGERPFQNIRADNHQVEGIIHTKTGDVEFHTLIKYFHFKKKSMEKSFNEKYMQSDRYPTTSFVGKIENFSGIDLSSPGTYTITVKGNLSIHHVTKWVSHPAIVTVTKNKLIAKSQFTVKPADFNIAVPKLFGRAMVSEINISVEMNFAL